MTRAGGPRPSRRPVPAAKLVRPQPLPTQVQRDRLTDALSAAPDQIVLLCAPAGHGKTTLLAAWAAAHADRVAWVTLDQGDHSREVFWSAILTALDHCPVVPRDSPLRRLGVPTESPTPGEFFETLTAGLADLPEPVLLVLDDVHAPTGPDVMSELEGLVAYRRGGLQIVLSTRTDPRLPLARWRVEGRLVELRRADLAFTAAETGELVRSTGLSLDEAQITTLHTQTDGWAAGLRLATMSLSTTDDAATFLSDLAGNDRSIADYLISEVLSRFPADVVDLLVRLSVCDQISAPLAIALTGSTAAPRLLAELERTSALVAAHGTGREWFRIHPLLRAHLKADLRRLDPVRKQELYARAARWYAADGQPAEALGYAERSRDPALTAEILHEHALTLLGTGRFDVLRATYPRCPAAAIDADPTLALVLALAFLDGGDAVASSDLARRADQAPASTGADDRAEHGWLRALVRVRLHWLTGQLDRDELTASGNPATPDETSDGAAELSLSHLTYAITSAARGDLGESHRLATSALHAARLADQAYVAAQAVVLLAVVSVAAGRLREAAEIAAEADEMVPASLWERTAEKWVTTGIRGYAALMAGDPAAALLLAGPMLAAASAESLAEPNSALTRLTAAMAHHDLGEGDQTLARVHLIRTQLPRDPLTLKVLALSAVWEHGLALGLGHTERAREVRESLRLALGPSGDVGYLLARHALARGREELAQRHLEAVIAGRDPLSTEWVAIAARIDAAELHLRHQRVGVARQLLTDALGLAAEYGVLRPLLGAPDPVVELMTTDPQLLGRHRETVAAVLRLRPAQQLPRAPLTPREIEILSLLPQLDSVADIAADLYISNNTMKTHLKSIYAKLGVDSRRAAVRAGRAGGYLPDA